MTRRQAEKSSQSAIQQEKLLSRMGTMSRLGGLLLIYARDYPGYLHDIRRAILERDSEALHKGAHALRGSLMIFAADKVAALARKLAKCSASFNTETDSLVSQLAAGCAQVQSELQALAEKDPHDTLSVEANSRHIGRVLVVEDDDTNRSLMRDALQAAGHLVWEADSAEQGLSQLASRSIDCLLLNVLMPGMDGFSMCQRVKSDPLTHRLPVILVTALEAREDRLRGIECGADDFLTKPLDLPELLLRVSNAVRSHQLYGELQVQHQQMQKTMEALRQSQLRLESRNEDLNAFTYSVSHDLKAPLRGILGYAAELQREHSQGFKERGQFCIEQIQEASTNLDRLIDDLLRYARLGSEQMVSSQVDLARIIDQLLRERALELEEANIKVRVQVPFATVLTWERAVSQILSNFLDNAIKFRQDYEPTIHIQAEESATNWRICVADNGIGFDMQQHDCLFGLFNRLEPDGRLQGTGAGLAIVKKLVQQHGGRVWAESSPGQGATFFAELPKPTRSAL